MRDQRTRIPLIQSKMHSFSNNDEYRIGCQQYKLIIGTVRYNKYNVDGLDQVELIGILEIFTLELQSVISNLATMSISILKVRNFEAIKKFP